jgi:hypothetical protein
MAGYTNWAGFVAASTINRKTFVKLNATVHKVDPAAANDVVVGVAQMAPRDPQGLPGSDPDIAARAGDSLAILRPGEIAIVRAATTITIGTHHYVKSDINGYATPATSIGTDNIAGIPITGGIAGDDIEIIVWPIPGST